MFLILQIRLARAILFLSIDLSSLRSNWPCVFTPVAEGIQELFSYLSFHASFGCELIKYKAHFSTNNNVPIH